MKLSEIKGIFEIGERKTFLELSEIIEIGRKANSIVIEMIKDGTSLVAATQDIRSLEKQSDQLSLNIKENILVAAVNPLLLDNILECVDLADSIVDNYHFVSKELNRIAKVKFSEDFVARGPDLRTPLQKMLDLADQAMVIILRILKATNMSKTAELRANIELVEEEGDNLKDNSFDLLYASAPNMHYLQFIHFSEILHKFDDILDSCEDLADSLVSVMAFISK
ncbi:MAG TPA: DUF47 family protein [archaeon]|nr:DUF47 family protein [archaeon]